MWVHLGLRAAGEGQMPDSAPATSAQRQSAVAHHCNGMRRVGAPSAPSPSWLLLACAAFSSLLIRAHANAMPSHSTLFQDTQLYIVCKDQGSQECITWLVAIENVEEMPNELSSSTRARRYCGLSDLKPLPLHRRFIAVKPFNENQEKITFCKIVNLISEDAFNLARIPDAFKAVHRKRRQAGYIPRGRYRGQAQSQYLAIDGGNGKDEGKAEAHSAADSSRASVSAKSGMGQAQSQTVYDPSCSECLGQGDLDAANLSRKPGTGNGQGNFPQYNGGHGRQGVPDSNTAGRPGIWNNQENLPHGGTGRYDPSQPGSNGSNLAGRPDIWNNQGNAPHGGTGRYDQNQIGPNGNGNTGNGQGNFPQYNSGHGRQGTSDSNTAGRPGIWNNQGNAPHGGNGLYDTNQGGSNINTLPIKGKPDENFNKHGSVDVPFIHHQDGSVSMPDHTRISNPTGIPGGGDAGSFPSQKPNNYYRPEQLGISGGNHGSNQVGIHGGTTYPTNNGNFMQNRPGYETQNGGPNRNYDTGQIMPNQNGSPGVQQPRNIADIASSSTKPFYPASEGGMLNKGMGHPRTISDGSMIPHGLGGTNGIQTIPSDSQGTNGANWPSSGFVRGADGLLYYCCVVKPDQQQYLQPSRWPGGPQQIGGDGSYITSVGGQQTPSGPYIPGTGGQRIPSGPYLPGPSGQQTGGGSYIPGHGSQQTPGGSYVPGTGGQQTSGGSYIPGTGEQQIPSGTYIPGAGGQTGGGSYMPGNVAQQTPSGSYTPGGGGQQNGGGSYIPDNGRPQTGGGTYIPGGSGQQTPSGSYMPGVGGHQTGGESYPHGVNGQKIPTAYVPSTGGHQTGGGSYLPGTGGQQTTSGTYMPGIGGQQTPSGSYIPGAGGQQTGGGSYLPGVSGQQIPSGYVPSTDGQQTGGGSYLPGTGGQHTPVGTYMPGTGDGSYIPGGGGQQTGSGSYVPGTGGQQTGGGSYVPGTGGQQTGGGSYVPGTGGQQTGGGSYVPGTGGQQPSGGSYVPGTGGQQTGGGSYVPGAGGQQTGGGSYVPGTGGQQTGGGSYVPGTGGQQTGGGSYVPGTGEQQTGGGTYVPGSGGQQIGGGSYVPDTGGQQTGGGSYVPGTGGQQTGGGSYIPNTGGQQIPSGTYMPGIGGQQTPSGSYMPGTDGQQTGSGSYMPGTGGQQTGGGSYIPSINGQQIPSGSYVPGGGGQQTAGGLYIPTTGGQPIPGGPYVPSVGGGSQGMGQNGEYGGIYKVVGEPQNVLDPNSIVIEDDDSQALATVYQRANGTTASASSSGGNDKGRAQTNVQGSYTDTGEFSAQASISDDNKGAESQVSGSKKGASSNAEGRGRKNKSQAAVKLGSETGSIQTDSQSSGMMHSSNTQVQGSVKGGVADAQARGPGSTSSQAQIGFTPYKQGDKAHELLKKPFEGGGTASAQSSGRIGTSQSQLRGTFKYGITYNGGAQAGASLDKDAVFSNLLPFEKIDVFDENDTNINVNIENTDSPPLESASTNKQNTNILTDNEEKVIKDSVDQFSDHTHFDHHKTNDEPNTSSVSPLAGNRRAFPSAYGNNNGADYEYNIDDSPTEEYDIDDVLDGTDNIPVEQGEYTNYDNYARETENTHQAQRSSSSRKGLEVKQTTGGNTQHILIGSLKNHDAKITQIKSERPDESRVYQPGERVPGMGGYTIPVGFTGSVKSVASKEKTYVVGSRNSPSQAQTVSLTPGTGRVKYMSPERNSKNVHSKDLRSLYNSKPDDNRYVSVSKSVTRDLDSENNIRKQYSHTYYTKSSSCGYFTFTCTMVSSAEGKKKVCRPKIPTNPDGSPMRC